MVLLSRALQGALLQPSLSATPRSLRNFHSSRTVRATPTTGSSSHHDDDGEHYPTEGFNSPIWRNSIILLVAGVGFYRVSTLHGDAPSTNRSEPVDGSEEEQNQHQENGKDNRPFITRYIDYYSTPSNVWKERNERHLDYVREKAEEKLLFQDAERPPVHRFRYSNTFEQASPHRMAVGAQADLSHLKIKRATE